jgi:hypothetical protein
LAETCSFGLKCVSENCAEKYRTISYKNYILAYYKLSIVIKGHKGNFAIFSLARLTGQLYPLSYTHIVTVQDKTVDPVGSNLRRKNRES